MGERLDKHLLAAGLFASRARAQEAIRAGCVLVDGAVAARASQSVPPGASVEVRGDVNPYVSRGGLKLEAALAAFDFDPKDRVCIDLGASTGGFTDVLLASGARCVYAIDVGTDQLHAKLRADPRVVCLEGVHGRHVTPDMTSSPVDGFVCDLSYISLKKAAGPSLSLCAPGAFAVMLVKPQFEVGRARIGKNGVVPMTEDLAEDLRSDFSRWLEAQSGWSAVGWIDSPIRGAAGNREFLLGGLKIRQTAP